MMESSSNNHNNNNNNNVYKILLLGDSNVGKTCIVQRFCDDSYIDGYISTIGIDFKQKLIKLHDDNIDNNVINNNNNNNSFDNGNDDKLIKLQLWDTAGQERFRSLTTAYYRGAMGIIIVFDITNLQSFQNIQYWFKNIDENASPNVIKILVGNKCDNDNQYNRLVDYDSARQLSNKYNIPYYECSCKHNLNINQIFFDICQRINKQLEQNENLFKYDNGSIEIIKHLENHQRKQRQQQRPILSSTTTTTSSIILLKNNDFKQNGNNNNDYGSMQSCTNCFTNYYYYYTNTNTNNNN